MKKRKDRIRKATFNELLGQGFVLVSFENKGVTSVGRWQFSDYAILKRKNLKNYPNVLEMKSKPRFIKIFYNVDRERYEYEDRRKE